MDEIELMQTLSKEIDRLDREAEAATDRFNKGYFEGRAESLARVQDALHKSDASFITTD